MRLLPYKQSPVSTRSQRLTISSLNKYVSNSISFTASLKILKYLALVTKYLKETLKLIQRWSNFYVKWIPMDSWKLRINLRCLQTTNHLIEPHWLCTLTTWALENKLSPFLMAIKLYSTFSTSLMDWMPRWSQIPTHSSKNKDKKCISQSPYSSSTLTCLLSTDSKRHHK